MLIPTDDQNKLSQETKEVLHLHMYCLLVEKSTRSGYAERYLSRLCPGTAWLTFRNGVLVGLNGNRLIENSIGPAHTLSQQSAMGSGVRINISGTRFVCICPY